MIEFFFCRVFHSKCWGGLRPRFQCALEKCKKCHFSRYLRVIIFQKIWLLNQFQSLCEFHQYKSESFNHSLFHCTIFPFIEYYGLSQGCAKIGDSWWTLEAPKHWTSLLVCIIASKFLVNFFFVNFFFFCISNSSNCYSWMS